MSKQVVKLSLMFLYVFFKFFPKKQVYLFGTNTNYLDSNSYALYRYLKEQGYTCFWVGNDEVKSCEPNSNVIIKYGSLKHIYLGFISKAYFITHTINDVFYFKPNGCVVVNLWHGMPVKMMGYDSSIFVNNNRFRHLLGLLPEFAKWDFFTCSSEFYRDILSNAFKIPKANFLITGSARNTYYKEIVKFEKTKMSVNLSYKIVYIPTYRGWSSSYLDFLNEEKFIDMLNDLGLTVIVKPHPYEINSFKSNTSRVIVSNDSTIESLYEVGDIFVTDVSSVIFDLYLRDKNIMLFATDMNDYLNKVGGSYIDFCSLSDGKAIDDLHFLIEAIYNFYKFGLYESLPLDTFIDLDLENNANYNILSCLRQVDIL